MAQLATINPESGVYAITYIDTQYNPETKIVEGTTGKKYASTYMGARSRWWDLSMAQAQLEAKGVAEHNKRVQQEILNLQDARANIIQGIPQRYDTMYKHHNAQQQMRKEWNAGSGDIWSTTTQQPRTTVTTRPQNRYIGHSGKGAYYVRRDVQGILSGVTSPVAKAASLDAARQVGTLGKDDNSMDQAAWYAINMDIENLYDSKVNGGMDAGQASIEAQNETLAAWEGGSPLGKSDASRWKKVNNSVKADFVSTSTTSGGQTTTARKGRKGLPEYYDPQTGETTALPWKIDPYAYDQELQVGRLEGEITAKEAELRPAIDMIDRARQVQREKFGPSIIQSFTEMAGRPSYSQSSREARMLQQLELLAQQGLTLEDLRSVTGYGYERPEGVPQHVTDPKIAGLYSNPLLGKPAQGVEEWRPGPPDEYENPEQAVQSGGGVKGFLPGSNKSTWQLNDGSIVVLERGGAGAGTPAVKGFKVGQKIKEGSYTWIVDKVSPDGQTIIDATFVKGGGGKVKRTSAAHKSTIDSLNTKAKGQEVEIKPAVEGGGGGSQRKAIHWKGGFAIEYVSDEVGKPFVVKNIGSQAKPMLPPDDDPQWNRDPVKLQQFMNPELSTYQAEEPPAIEPPTEEDVIFDESGGTIDLPAPEDKKPIEESEGSLISPEGDSALAGRGSPKIQGHNANLLKGFVGANEMINKPRGLERKIKNAETGSPAEFARTTMDAWKDADPNQRPTLSEMVSNIAQQFQGSPERDRQKALEYTIALYQLETESDLLT